MAAPSRADLVGTTFPPGEFLLDVHHARLWADAVGAEDDDDVFPGVAYLVAMRGGASIATVMELLETKAEMTLFGELAFDFTRRLRTGCRYRVDSSLIALEAKTGKRRGPFDLVTLEYLVSELDSGLEAARITQVWIVSRPEAGA